jgi:hypothetical protein
VFRSSVNQIAANAVMSPAELFISPKKMQRESPHTMKWMLKVGYKEIANKHLMVAIFYKVERLMTFVYI